MKLHVILYAVLVSSVSLAQEDDEPPEPKQTHECVACAMCKKKCTEDYLNTSDEYKQCVETQAFCCDSGERCSLLPRSKSSVPPWGLGLITILVMTAVAILVFWVCLDRRCNLFKLFDRTEGPSKDNEGKDEEVGGPLNNSASFYSRNTGDDDDDDGDSSSNSMTTVR